MTSCFFDEDRVIAPGQLRILLSKLTRRVLLLADNVLSHPSEIVGYLNALRELTDFEHVIVPLGKGLSIACRTDLVTCSWETPSDALEKSTGFGSQHVIP
jgi:hypothetical protein